MCWEKHKGFCQHKKQVGVEPRPWLQNSFLCRMMVMMVALILIISVAIGWSRTVYAAPASQSSTVAVVGAEGAPLYTTPGGETVAELAPSTVFTAIGRSGDGLWVVVQTGTGQSGWLEASKITIFGLEQLPVMMESVPSETVSTAGETPGAAPSAPTAESLPTPTVIPTPVPTPSPTLVAVVAVVSNSSSGGGQASAVAVVRGGGAGLYDQPGGTQLEELAGGTALTAWGRSADGEWLGVTAPSGTVGWVQSTTTLVSNLNALPILDPATGLPAASVSESSDDSGTVAQPTPTSEVTPETDSGQVDTALSTDPNNIIAKVIPIDSHLNIRNGPGTNYLVIGKAVSNDTFKVIGRNDAATWVNIVAPEVPDGVGWVSADFVVLSQPILSVPIVGTVTPITSPESMAVGNISCTTNQIIKWDSSLATWVCSDDLTLLQSEVAALQAEVAALQAEIVALKK